MERTSPVARVACALAVSLCCAAAYGRTAVAQVNADAFKRGVVKIRTQTPAHGDESGAGIIVGRDEHLVVIVTAQHVVMDAPQVEVVFFDKPYKEFQGKPFRKYHEELDIAVVIVDVGQEPLIPPDRPRFSVGDVARLKEGEKVSIIGHPLDQEWQASLNTNSLAGLSAQEDARKLRLTRTALERGNSGGPVFTERRALIGMVTTLEPLYAVAVKIDAVLTVLRDEWRLPTWWRPEEARMAFARELAAHASTLRRQIATREPGEAGDYWWHLLTRKGRRELLERSVLLAVEAMQRAPVPEAEHVLRDGLVWLTHPVMALRHNASVTAIAVSPDGTWLATASEDKTARLWEFASGREVARLAHQGPVTAVAFSPHGPYLATASRDATARVWEVPSGREVARLAHTAFVRAALFSTDGAYLDTTSGSTASPLESNTVRVWAVPSGRESVRIIHQPDQGTSRVGVEAMALSPDGQFLATASDDQTARLWAMPVGRETRRLEHASAVQALAFSPDGRYLATGSRDGTAQVWEVSSGQIVQQVPHDDAVVAVAFSPDGQWLAAASQDATARVWAVRSGQELARLTHGGQPLEAVAFSPDGQFLVTQGRGKTVGIWRLWPADLVAEACSRLTRNLTPEEWHHYLGEEPYRKTCPHLQ